MTFELITRKSDSPKVGGNIRKGKEGETEKNRKVITRKCKNRTGAEVRKMR